MIPSEMKMIALPDATVIVVISWKMMCSFVSFEIGSSCIQNTVKFPSHPILFKDYRDSYLRERIWVQEGRRRITFYINDNIKVPNMHVFVG